MSDRQAKRTLALFAVLSFVVLFAGSVAAQGRSPDSLQPDLFITLALHRDTPVAHGNVLVLPSRNRRATFARLVKNGSSLATAPSITTNALNLSLSPYSVGPIITPTQSEPEAEEEIAADPSDITGSNLISAVSDFSQASGFNFTKWALSTDGGSSAPWREDFVPNNSTAGMLVTSDGRSWNANSDPVLAFDRSGNVYLSDLYIAVDSFGRITSEGL